METFVELERELKLPAIQRYIKEENISETQMEMDNDIQINHIEFDDEFGAYSVWE